MQLLNLTLLLIIFVLIYKIFKEIKYLKKYLQSLLDNQKYHTVDTDIKPISTQTKKLIGIGGGGSNIVEYLSNNSLSIYDSLVINSDKKALDQKDVPNKIYLKSKDNLGCGSNDKCGFHLIDESVFKDIKKFIGDNSSIYIVTTLGGGVGSGSTKAIVKYLYDQKIQVHISIVLPFSWEGIKRSNRAQGTLAYIQPYCTTIKIFNNDDLKQYNKSSMKECFSKLNQTIDSYIGSL